MIPLNQQIKDGTVKDGKPSEKSAKRQSHGQVGYGFHNVPSACGVYDSNGTPVSDALYPYWRMLMWGSEPVYRLMRQQYTIDLALYVVTGPIRASAWDYTHDDDISDDDPAIKWVKENILPLRRRVIRDAVRAIEYGWQPFAVKWEIRDGMYYPTPSPLLPDATLVLQNEQGDFAGLENRPFKGDKQTFSNLESWAPCLDSEAGYAYGRSRFENIRTTAWAGWLTTVMRLRELEQNIAGIIPIVKHPPNGYKDLDTLEYVNFADEANKVLSELPKGRGVRLETALTVEQIMSEPEIAVKLADIKLFDVSFYDASKSVAGIQGMISMLEYWDKGLFRGMLRPERAGLEAVAAGSRADSEQHTETGAADSEAIDADLTDSFDENVVRTALRLNFGEERARKIHVVSTPLLKWKQQVFREMLTRLVSIPEIAVGVAKSLDLDAMFSQMSLPTLKAFVVEAAREKPTNPVAPANGNVNGNGKAKPDEKQIKLAAENLAVILHDRFKAA